AKYLGDSMLPDGPQNNINTQSANVKKQAWEIIGKVEQLHYGRLLAKNVEFKLGSNGDLGYISMQHLHVSQTTQLHDIDARVRLLGEQEGISIERMQLQGLKQLIRLSATVKQQTSERWQWRGTMKVEGEFDPLVSLIDANQHFIGGSLLAQFEGRGVFVRGKPWWDDIDGNLEIDVKKGRVQDGGTMSRLLSITSLVDIPRLLLLQRGELFGEGMYYEQLRFQSRLRSKMMHIDKMAMRAPAMDLVGFGSLDMSNAETDLIVVVRPFQNIDKLIGSIPIVRDIIGGSARSIMRKAYHVHGRLSDAIVEKTSFKDAGLEAPGLLEGLLSLPGLWFDAIAGEEKPAHGQ
ncbi:MAG: AsmA-like C-terminal domain-containing protein, partial [Mariprofundales bacterium]